MTKAVIENFDTMYQLSIVDFWPAKKAVQYNKYEFHYEIHAYGVLKEILSWQIYYRQTVVHSALICGNTSIWTVTVRNNQNY